MRILLDTDVIMDFIMKRTPFSDDADRVIELCMENNIDGCIAAHAIPNLHYILRKHLTLQQRRDVLLQLCRMFIVVGIDAAKIESALQNDDFTDFEDCLQVECAKDFSADFIITRNIKDYHDSVVPVVIPSEFLEKFS